MAGLQGKKLTDYFNANTESWLGARYIINGKDKNQLIMSYVLHYYAAISYNFYLYMSKKLNNKNFFMHILNVSRTQET